MLKKLKKIDKNFIGILGGSFDPPHIGHLKLSKHCVKKLKLSKIYWVITKKNPFKSKPLFKVNDRIDKCKKLINGFKHIKVKYLDRLVGSSRTIEIIKYIKKKDKNSNIILIIGSDNLITFNKWKKWKELAGIVKIAVLSRKGFDFKAKNSIASRFLGKESLIFINNKKVNISSSNLRKNYLK